MSAPDHLPAPPADEGGPLPRAGAVARLRRRQALAGLLRLAAALAVLAALALVTAPALRAAWLRRVAPALDAWRGQAPRALPDLRPGDRVGVTIMVECRPAGAELTVDGQPRGSCPAIISHECRTGHPINLQARLAGHRPTQATRTCDGQGTLRVSLTLPRQRPN